MLKIHTAGVQRRFRPLSVKRIYDQLLRSYSAPAYFHRVGKTPLFYRTIGQQLLRAVELYGKQSAIVSCHEQRRLTFEEARHEAEILAIKLKDLKLQPGDHVGIWAPNTMQWYISMLAAALGGFPIVCINPALQADELKYALQKAKVTVLITMDEYGKQNFKNILENIVSSESSSLPYLRKVIMKMERNKTQQFLDYDELRATPTRSQDIEILNKEILNMSPEAPCNIQFTSGTTGKPKAALLTHFNYVNMGHYFGNHIYLYESPKNICFVTPFFHAFGFGITMAALDHGATLVLPSPTFNGALAVEAIEKEKCNILIGTPTMFIDMLENQQKLQKEIQSLEYGLIGGASCSPSLCKQVKTVFKLKEFCIGYGQTEASAASFCQNGTETITDIDNSVGTLLEHYEAKVINEKGDTVAFGETGELCVRGYSTMIGYFEDEEKTKETLNGGWLRTGDEFTLESNGVGRIMGRKKDLIIRGGENIFPKEIEDFLNTHESILESQVIGVPDERMGEEICAYLRLKADQKPLDVNDIKEFCKGKIAHFKIPRYVRIIQDYPKTASGKIQKFKLCEMFVAEKSNES